MQKEFSDKLIAECTKQGRVSKVFAIKLLKEYGIEYGSDNFWENFWIIAEKTPRELAIDVALTIEPQDQEYPTYTEKQVNKKGKRDAAVAPVPSSEDPIPFDITIEDLLELKVSERDADIWLDYRTGEVTQQAIADEVGLSRQRVITILKNVNKKIGRYCMDTDKSWEGVYNSEVNRNYHPGYATQGEPEDSEVREARETIDENGYTTMYKVHDSGKVDPNRIYVTRDSDGKSKLMTLRQIVAFSKKF